MSDGVAGAARRGGGGVDLGSRAGGGADDESRGGPAEGLGEGQHDALAGCNAPDARVRVSAVAGVERAVAGARVATPGVGAVRAGARERREQDEERAEDVRSVAGDEANARRASAGRPPEEPPRRAREATRIARMGPVETN